MFLPGWSIWCVILTLPVSACGVEISGYSGDEVICSQGLSECTMNMGHETDLTEADDDAVDILRLTASPKLCCKDGAACKICLMLDVEINIHLDVEKDVEDEGHSGLEEEDYSEETGNPKASLKMCHYTPLSMPTCKKVEFTVNHTALTQQNQSKLLMVITEPAGVTFGSHVTIYPSRQLQLRQEVRVFSLDKVCNQELQERVKECHVPKLISVINQEMNQVELQSAGSNKSLLCIQYEGNGKCREVTVTTPIPLYSVTPCTCFQVWEVGELGRRSKSCPFRKTNFLQKNVWQNVSVFVRHDVMNNHSSMLSWNVSAPCRLDGEVWPCHRQHSCREMEGFRQQLKGAWRQNSRGQWKIEGVFEDINLQLSPCVMMKLKGLEHQLGPFCVQNTDRWHWSLLVVGVMLLVCLTVLIKCGLHDYVKKWVWSFHHDGFVKIGGNRLVVLLSPPDVDGGVSESVCQLGSMLCTRGFCVSVDQWSRKEQCTLGPLPWLHSQLLELNSQGGKVVLVVTRKALERAEEWTHWHKKDIRTKGQENWGLPLTGSPYSDVFMASLCLIEADRLQGRAGERFLLATFDSNPRSDRNLPELLHGLRLFQLPSQTGALLTELTVGGTGNVSWKRWCLRLMDSRDYREGRAAEGIILLRKAGDTSS